MTEYLSWMFDSTLEVRNLEHGLKYLRTYPDNGKWLTVSLPTLCMESRCPDRNEPMKLRKPVPLTTFTVI
jgi:hypothetical protein